jgi:hypothetical protein
MNNFTLRFHSTISNRVQIVLEVGKHIWAQFHLPSPEKKIEIHIAVS